jgi:hypothetical protein
MADRQTFIDFIAGLAVDGETALLVKQKPFMQNGELQYHTDGTLRCTWPAFLPTHVVPDGASWYANTGAFVLDRFSGGKLSASRSNCEYVLVMMLDDIGTKSKTPPLPPTWIMETSPGSFQWGYAFSDQPTKSKFTAAIRAIADAGYTDPGATNAVRNFRLPGSVNLKPGRDNFAARLVEFHPEREYTLDEICQALGVEPGADDEDGADIQAVKLRDTGKDTVLQWLNDNNMVLSLPNADGWLSIVCPNHAEHTDGNIGARYKPLDRSFDCFHGHCAHLDSRVFLDWVAENGGPRVTPGLRDELLAERMTMALDKLSPTPTYPDRAADIIAEVERKERGRLEKSDWFNRYAYVQSDDSYFDIQDREEVTRVAFNAIYRHVECRSVHNPKQRILPAHCFDENRQAAGARTLSGVTYAAGDTVFVSRGGLVYGNRWIDARPDVSGVEPGDVSRWLAHCETLIPEPDELRHCLDAMAFKVQNPRIKINHAILHGGDEGCGKDTMWAPFLWAVCGPTHRNRSIVDNDGLASQWGYNLEVEIMVLNELKEPEARERRALSNKLKPVIAAPPDTLTVNRKGLHPYDMVNRVFVLAFTNDPLPITIPSQDRRWFCLWSNAPRMDPEAARDLWAWYEAGGFATIARWLHDRDVSRFNPAAAPAVTDFKRNMVEHGMSGAEAFLVQLMRERKGPFAPGAVAGPFHTLIDVITRSGLVPAHIKIPQAALLHAFKEAGWADQGRVATRENATKRHVFAAPHMKHMNKSDLRRIAETGEVQTADGGSPLRNLADKVVPIR